MKVLHTSDWHIGQRLYTNFRDEEHSLFFDWLIEQINVQKVDLLIVSGDIFDVAFPSNQALKLYYKALYQISTSYCKNIIIVGGNHDSPSTLGAPKEILQFLNIHIVGGISDDLLQQIIEIKIDEKVELVVCAVPFLRDSDIRKSTEGESYEDKTISIKAGISNHYKALSELTQIYKQQNIPVIATGHLFATGVSKSDSEREIYIGNLGSVEAENILFSFDYLALGHIHKPQKVAKNEFIRYSGSLIPLSFSEQNDSKCVLLLDISRNSKTIESLEVPQFRKLVSLKGSFLEVRSRLLDYTNSSQLTDWLEIYIHEDKINHAINLAFEELKADLKHIEILKFNISFAEQLTEITSFFDQSKSIADIDVLDVFQNMMQEQQVADKEELTLIFKELVEQIENYE